MGKTESTSRLKFFMVIDTRKRHPQLFEAGLHRKKMASIINLFREGGGRVLQMTNGFGYFCRNKSSHIDI
ncbi:hypothetical protein RYU24_19060 [Acinetobacter variabilis]|nr:hypothetical protein RYU24_19060 [Acinetobacter variabilis]